MEQACGHRQDWQLRAEARRAPGRDAPVFVRRGPIRDTDSRRDLTKDVLTAADREKLS